MITFNSLLGVRCARSCTDWRPRAVASRWVAEKLSTKDMAVCQA